MKIANRRCKGLALGVRYLNMQYQHQLKIHPKPSSPPSVLDSASKSLPEIENITTEAPVLTSTANEEIEEIPEDDSSLVDNAPIIALLESEKIDTEIILDTKGIKSELSSKYSGLKKSVRTELAYLRAFSEQPAPCLRSVFKLILHLAISVNQSLNKS